ncbi:biopolymer transporter ExbD, partial [Flavobacteriaceae bacterium]|nr:biopolymer transporter ExbD [Flavobacteriaceae bacterium]
MKLKGRNQIKPEFNMSSMTDVVFLLLIFFMIASTLAKQLNTIEVKLPQGEGKTENRNTVAVTITDGGRFYINEDRVAKNSLENRLISSLGNGALPSIVLRAEKKVAIQEV